MKQNVYLHDSLLQQFNTYRLLHKKYASIS